MLWFTYARVSSDEQARLGFSLPSQQEACRQRARDLGASQIVDFSDEGVPGDLLERPGISKLRDATAKGGAAGLVVYDPDRLARNLSHQLLLTEEFEKAGLRIEFVNFDWKDTPEGKLFYSIRGAISEYEKEKIRERTVRGRRQKAKMGRLTGHPHTYGYNFDPVTDTLSINEEQAEVVRTIFRWVKEERVGARTVAGRLNRMGATPARAATWWAGSVRRILLNSTYIGVLNQMRYDFSEAHKNKYRSSERRVRVKERPRDEWIPVHVPAIIDLETWNAVQDYMANANRAWRALGRSNHLLTGLTRCSHCGKPMSGTTSRGHRYYRCVGYLYRAQGTPTCGQKTRRADEVEAHVWGEVESWIRSPEKLKALLYGAMEQEADTQSVERELQEIRRALEGLVKERQRVVSLFQKDLLPEEEVTIRLAEIKGREQELHARESHLSQLAKPVDNQVWKAFEEAAAHLEQELANLDDDGRRVFLHWFVAEVVIYSDRVAVIPKTPTGQFDALRRVSERPG